MATLGILGHSGIATSKLNGRTFNAECSFMWETEPKWLRLVTFYFRKLYPRVPVGYFPVSDSLRKLFKNPLEPA